MRIGLPTAVVPRPRCVPVANSQGIRDDAARVAGALDMAEGGDEQKAGGGTRAVFISYASEDAAPAERIVAALRAAGIEVWFDKNELRGGDVWDRKINEQIHRCRLFIPVISANTEARDEGYFRREWGIALDRMRDMAEHKTFLVPVAIDGTAERSAAVPERFRHVQWSRLVEGQGTPAFVNRITALLAAPTPSATAGLAVPAAELIAPPQRRNRRAVWSALGIFVLAIALGGGWLAWRHLWTSAPSAPSSAIQKSIAVLPFLDMSEKHDQEYFSDGLTEELIGMLAHVSGLKVIARTSSFYFKGKQATTAEIARTLNVTHVLEGSVRRSGEHLRVTTQLVRASTGEDLWSETYDRELEDVFHLQDEIANAVVAALALRLGGGQPFPKLHGTSNLQAYDEFLECRELYKRAGLENFRRASEACSKAIAFDPKYAAAYAQLAIAEAYVADLTGDVDLFSRSFEAADMAVALGPEQADGYAARGTLRFNYGFDWRGAQSDISRALAISPDDSWVLSRYARLLTSLGRYSDAIDANKRALEIDPLLPSAWEWLAYDYQALRNLPAALEASHRAVGIRPDNPYALYRLALTLLLQGRGNEALAAFNQMNGAEPLALCGIAMTEFTLGRGDKSREALGRLIDQDAMKAAYQVAMVYAWRGEKDQAFKWLERARQQHDGGVAEVKCDPFLESLRSDARYKAFLRTMNLPD
jgi:adenylate cyclase